MTEQLTASKPDVPTRLRSLLFVPGDRPERFSKAMESGADAVIFDIEDAVARDRKSFARSAVSDFLLEPRSAPKFVRINPIGDNLLGEDVAASRGADGIVLPKVDGIQSLTILREKWGADCPPILPIVCETPRAIFHLNTVATIPGLIGLTWGAEDLHVSLMADAARETTGELIAPLEIARSLTLFAARASGIQAIDTVYPAVKDLAGLAAYAARAKRHGFSGMLAIHPAQVDVINESFKPSGSEIARAREIVAAFSQGDVAGAFQLDGTLVDAPHLAWAHRQLALSG